MGGVYSRKVFIRRRCTFEGGVHSREEFIQGRCLFEGGVYSRKKFIWGRSLFEGGVYLREVFIRERCLFWKEILLVAHSEVISHRPWILPSPPKRSTKVFAACQQCTDGNLRKHSLHSTAIASTRITGILPGNLHHVEHVNNVPRSVYKIRGHTAITTSSPQGQTVAGQELMQTADCISLSSFLGRGDWGRRVRTTRCWPEIAPEGGGVNARQGISTKGPALLLSACHLEEIHAYIWDLLM